MPAPADRNSPYPPNNLNLLYQRHRSRLQGADNLSLRPVPSGSHDSGTQGSYGSEGLQRIYPREITRNRNTKLRPGSSTHPVTSPLISALGSTTNTATQYTSDWARSLPFFAATQTPSHSGSPPAASLGRDGSLPGANPSSSPSGLRAQSHPNQYPNFGGRRQTPRDRRASAYSSFGQSPYSGHVPLPHEDQAHFYAGGLPDLDSIIPNMTSAGGLSPGEKGYYVGFDTLATSGHGPSISAENILLLGEEGALRVYKVSRKSADIVGRLEGLRGAVVAAKILPWTFRDDPGASARPYVAVVVNGPVLPEDETRSSDASGPPSVDDDSDPSAPRTAGVNDIRDAIKQYQTTVEVYSLSSREHVATIFQCPPVDVEISRTGELKIPPPTGDLKLDANGKFLLVASGSSGELFVFSPYTRDTSIDKLQSIRCVGKFWTSVHVRDTKPSANGEPNPNQEDQDAPKRTALYCLSHRWLAILPPSADSLFSMSGSAMLANSSPKPPGITHHVSPQKPHTNCGVDTPDGDTFMDRAYREISQQAIKGALWVGEQGKQAWKSYWNPTPGQPAGSYVPEMANPAFPPTHGHDQSPSKLPTQVAIYDLQRLLGEEVKAKHALTPLATFEPPSGCSFLSFSPNGLFLLTVSKKGDLQHVWGLNRMQHPRTGILYDQLNSAHVRQIVRFFRYTDAIVVDCKWNVPHGNRFSLVTERGTIHVYEIPRSAIQWPPLRRARKQVQPPRSSSDPNDQAQKGAVSTAMDTINGTTNWIRSVSMRPRSIGSSAALGNIMMTPAATASVGGKIVKSGFTKGVSLVANSANTIYHASDNKLHIGNSANGIVPGCMHWMTGRDRGYLAVVVSGTLSLYHVRQTRQDRKGKPPIVSAKIAKKPIEFVLHKISDAQFAPAYISALEARMGSGKRGDAAVPVGGFWHLRTPVAAGHVNTAVRGQRRKENWHALVEAETNPPYQPFHTDRRITLSTYDEPEIPRDDLPLLKKVSKTPPSIPQTIVRQPTPPPSQKPAQKPAEPLLDDFFSPQSNAEPAPTETNDWLDFDHQEPVETKKVPSKKKKGKKGGKKAQPALIEGLETPSDEPSSSSRDPSPGDALNRIANQQPDTASQLGTSPPEPPTVPVAPPSPKVVPQAPVASTALADYLLYTHHIPTPGGPAPTPWVFGEDIPSTAILTGDGTGLESSFSDDGALGANGFGAGSTTVENRIRVIEGADGEQVIVTTVRRRGREEEEFFEDGCEMLDFADERV